VASAPARAILSPHFTILFYVQNPSSFLFLEELILFIWFEKRILVFRLIQNPIWGFQSDKSSEACDDLGATNGGSSKNYLSSMFNTAKQKASILRWPQTDLASNDDVSDKSVSSTAPESSQAGRHGASTPSDGERDDTLISSRLSENNNAATMDQRVSAADISYTAESYKKFKEEQELKLQEWLRESKGADSS
jgi:hypothetical protein